MRALKVADVSRYVVGGMLLAMVHNGKALERRGHAVDYLLREELLSSHWPLKVRRLVAPIAVVLRVLARCRAQRVDVVEIHEPAASLYSWAAGTRLGRRRLPRCVVLSHGLEERCWRTLVNRRSAAGVRTPWLSRVSVLTTLVGPAQVALRRAAHVIVLNEADRRHLLQQTGLPDARVTPAANGVDAGRFAAEAARPDGLSVLFMGSWIERKGIADLAAGWDRLQASHHSLSLTLAGTTASATEVLAAFAPRSRPSITVEPRVTPEHVPALFARHHVLVLPSWYEGMPLVVLEAAAAGLAVVATAIPGVVEIFRPPEPEQDGAVLVTPQHPAELAEALGRLATEPGLLAHLQGRGRQRAAAFTWDASAACFETAYRSALAATSW